MGPGNRVEELGVDVDRERRRVGGLGEDVGHRADRQRLGVGEVEDLAVEARLVGQVVHRLRDVVDRDDVDLAAFDADAAQPRRRDPAQPLDGAEEVVRAVDLVDLAGLGVADDEAGR